MELAVLEEWLAQLVIQVLKEIQATQEITALVVLLVQPALLEMLDQKEIPATQEPTALVVLVVLLALLVTKALPVTLVTQVPMA